MSTKLGVLIFVVSGTVFLGACSSPEVKNTSQSEIQLMNQLVEANDKAQTTDDQEVFLLEQYTPDGKMIDSGSVESSGFVEAPEESPSN